MTRAQSLSFPFASPCLSAPISPTRARALSLSSLCLSLCLYLYLSACTFEYQRDVCVWWWWCVCVGPDGDTAYALDSTPRESFRPCKHSSVCVVPGLFCLCPHLPHILRTAYRALFTAHCRCWPSTRCTSRKWSSTRTCTTRQAAKAR